MMACNVDPGWQMRIKQVRIQNFRSCEDATFGLAPYTCLIGPNGSGKSTVLQALNIFFREDGITGLNVSELEEQDFHFGNTKDPVEITVTFVDLGKDAQDEFAAYYRNGELIVSAFAEFNIHTLKAPIRQRGHRTGIESFRTFFEAQKDKKPADELKKIYESIRSDFPDLPQVKAANAIEQQLREYEQSHPDECSLIPSEDEFYGFSRGKDRLEKYIQWIYVPAVKEASQEQLESKNTAIGKLLQRTVRLKVDFSAKLDTIKEDAKQNYSKLLQDNQKELAELSGSLEKRLQGWSHPSARMKIEWRLEPERAVRVDPPIGVLTAGESDFLGDVARLGHGLQRSVILALLQELASLGGENGPSMILGCEEPELYQHPLQARHLAEVFRQLSSGSSQVLVTSHSPYFVEAEAFESIRIVRKADNKRSLPSSASLADVSKALAECTGKPQAKPQGMLTKIKQTLNPTLSEMFFCNGIVFVESYEDRAYLTSVLMLTGKWEEFRSLGIDIIPVGRKSDILEPLVIAQRLSIPAFVVFDGDADKIEKPTHRECHERDNKAILVALSEKELPPIPSKTIYSEKFVMWHNDIGAAVAEELGDVWEKCQTAVDVKYGHLKNQRKYEMHIASSLEQLWGDGKVCDCLTEVCSRILRMI